MVTDPLPSAAFDLLHARCLLEHLPARDAVLAKLVDAVRPGGHLVVSDCDCDTPMAAAMSAYIRPADRAPLYRKGYAAVAAAFRMIGARPDFGTELHPALRGHGLLDVGGTINAPVVGAGSGFRVRQQGADRGRRREARRADRRAGRRR